MTAIATITSKKQLTLPSKLFRKARFEIGQKLIVSEENGRLILTPAERLVEELAGSLSRPKKWKGKSLRQIREMSKDEYFRHQKR